MAAYLSIPEALAELRRDHDLVPSYHQLWAAIARGAVPAARVGRHLRVNRAALPAVAELFKLPKHAAG
jgi:hypothetical protein